MLLTDRNQEIGTTINISEKKMTLLQKKTSTK